MRILVVEDEHNIANAIKKGFEQESWATDVAFTGTNGYDMAAGEEYDVIVLDLMLPGMDGITICKKLREEGVHTPILMLTAKGRTDEKVDGLNSGADDYLPKPFSFTELLARVRALSRRPKQTLPTELSVSDLTLNTIEMSVRRANKSLKLSKTEFALLEYLMRNAGKTLSKDQIIQSVWDYDADILPNTVEVYIGYLRGKLGKPGLIHTARGFGYRIGEDNV